MDLNRSLPFRLLCNIPLACLAELTEIIPVVLALMFKDDTPIPQGTSETLAPARVICEERYFAMAGHFFRIEIAKRKNEIEVMVQDITTEDFIQRGGMVISHPTMDIASSIFNPN